MSSRQDANREIVNLISALVEKNPSLRFGQILAALDVATMKRDADGCVVAWTDEFNTESVVTLARMQKALKTLP